MKRNHYAKWFVLILLFAEVFVSSAAITLNIGDQAPKIQVSKWVQGEAVTDFKTNNTYLLEFWATCAKLLQRRVVIVYHRCGFNFTFINDRPFAAGVQFVDRAHGKRRSADAG